MSSSIQKPDYHYVAYVDESGDPGLKRVKPVDAVGSSEWLIVSGVVIDAKREVEVPGWMAGALAALGSRQLKDIHFAKLNDVRRAVMCRQVASRPLRCFVVASNKKNMRNHHNPNAAKVPSDNWFYCWLNRVLLERMTHFVATDSIKRHGEIKRVKVEYSERGGLRYSQMRAYYEWLRPKSRAGNMFLTAGDFEWDTIHPHLLEVHPHQSRAGLKLADTVAGAFFQAADCVESGPCNPGFAKLLKDRMARDPDKFGGQVAGYGVKLMPSFYGAKLTTKQAEIFRFYGYPQQWWAPASSAPGAF
jgi:hypothetical protein